MDQKISKSAQTAIKMCVEGRSTLVSIGLMLFFMEIVYKIGKIGLCAEGRKVIILLGTYFDKSASSKSAAGRPVK